MHSHESVKKIRVFAINDRLGAAALNYFYKQKFSSFLSHNTRAAADDVDLMKYHQRYTFMFVWRGVMQYSNLIFSLSYLFFFYFIIIDTLHPQLSYDDDIFLIFIPTKSIAYNFTFFRVSVII
jgi:hypothetical protein